MRQLKKILRCKAQLLGVVMVLLCSSTWAQKTVTGKVVSATSGEPLIGATVLVKGTNTGALTDANGNYTVNVDNPSTAVLVFSYLSYVTQEVEVAGRQVVNVELSEESRQLDEVVVIGYGTVKKKDLTGSVTSVKASEIAAAKASNPLEALQGKATGIDMTRTSGRADAAVSINLRGNRSLLASNEPLILVDGVEYGSTIDINPSDIESVDVLKDASSTAIYGTRGANGVIIITTKRGGQGKSRVSFSSYVSYNVPTFVPRFMNTGEFVEKRFQTLIADSVKKVYDLGSAVYNPATNTVTWNQTTNPQPWAGFDKISIQDIMNGRHVTNPYQLITNDPTALSLLDAGTSLDYLDMIFRNSYTQNYELSVTGGDQKTSYSFSLGYMDDRGLLRNDKMRRFNVKLGADHQLFKRLKIGANVLLTNKKNLKRDAGIFNQALKTGTVGILYNDDGTYRQYPDNEFTKNQPNPMLDEAPGANLNDSTTNRMFGTGYISWEPLKGITFRSNLGVDLSFNRNGNYMGPTSLRRIALNKAQTNVDNQSMWSYTWDNTLTLQKTMGSHDFQILLGSSLMDYELEKYSMIGIDQQTSTTTFYDWNNFTQLSSASNYVGKSMASVFGRINYKFLEKYLLTASLRADGTSVLAKGSKNKWDYFPSVALGWRLKEEDAMKGVDWISNMKLRLSWGKSGNAAISPYQTITELSKTPAYYSFDDKTFAQNIPFKLGEPTLSWEITETWDAGLDFGFLNERVRGGVDVYLANTTNLLLPVELPGAFPQITMNAGSTRNKGIEVVLSTVNVKTRNFEWSMDWNFAANRDEVVSLNTGTTQTVFRNNRIYRIGSPTSAFYDYKKDGIYQIADLQAEYEYLSTQIASGAVIDRARIPMISNKFLPGDIKLADNNPDGIFNDLDKVLYNRSPKFTFGFNNNFYFAGFGLSVVVFGRIGQYLQYGLYQAYKPADLFVENGPYVDAWTPENSSADFPRYYTVGNAKSFLNSMTYRDGSFVKVKDITFSYSFPKKLLNKVRISNLKIYATGKNLFVLSNIDNYDPEVGGTMNFPLAKQYIVGLNFDF